MSEEMKPCPFCGNQDVKCIEGDDSKWDSFIVYCPKCNTETGGEESQKEAIGAWNKRISDKEVVKKSRIRKVIQSEEFRHYFNTPITKKLEGIVGKKKEGK